MKIVIIGSGAMGCLYGAYLSRKHEVIMLDSFDKQVEAILKTTRTSTKSRQFSKNAALRSKRQTIFSGLSGASFS